MEKRRVQEEETREADCRERGAVGVVLAEALNRDGWGRDRLGAGVGAEDVDSCDSGVVLADGRIRVVRDGGDGAENTESIQRVGQEASAAREIRCV